MAENTYAVRMRITRSVLVIIPANDALEARTKASDLEYSEELNAEVVHWAIDSVTATDSVEAPEGTVLW